MPGKELSPVDQALMKIEYGLYIITSRRGEKVNGLLGNVVTQVSDEPNRIAISVNKKSLTHDYIAESGVFGVSVLAEETPLKFSGMFGFRSGRDFDKFADVNFTLGTTGCPLVLEHSLAVLEAKVIDTANVGKHTIFIAEIVDAHVVGDGKPLTYAHYRDVKRGLTPVDAPTPTRTAPMMGPMREDWERSERAMQSYVCDVCGYVYDPEQGDPDNGVEPGTAFEDLPDDWTCPVCGAAKDEFSPA